ncbi:ankyrin repeat-containing domain protein [Fusarium oxysporum]|nr:ankyrin repeat-containing domain protein [Fusarium oxysporum]
MVMSNPQKYTVGWICAIATEYLAAQLFLDEEHEGPEFVSANDSNNYTLGKIGKHNVVIAVLPHGEYGISSAAGVARDMLHSFPNVRFGLMVGIGGGAPTTEHDIRLGDVVVSASGHGKGGVFQYDFGKAVQGQEFQETGFLNQPPTILRTAVHGLLTQYKRKGHQLHKHIDDILVENPRLKKEFQRPESSTDRLYHSSKVHPPNDQSSCAKACGDDPSTLVVRPGRTEDEDNPAIHYGLIASANRLMKDALTRDALAAKKGVLCFEMEAAGLMNHFPCLVIRGICDYSDSHKNKEWQGFAAMMAAAYAKDLLHQIPPSKVEAEKPISEILSSSYPAFQEWKLGTRQHLWLYGLAGCGKTILSTTILDHLLQIDTHTTLAFFFDFNDARKQKLEDLLRSLAVQLYYTGNEAARRLDNLFTSHDDGRRQPDTNALSAKAQLIRDPRSFGKRNCVQLDKNVINADIRSYVEATLEQKPDFVDKKLSPSILEEIRDKIGDGADGMFRWAACQLETLARCLSPKDIKTALRSLPRDLNETYCRMLQNIPSEYKRSAIRLLQFLVYTKRPLELAEAIEVIATEIDQEPRGFDVDGRLSLKTDILRYCPSLVIIAEVTKSIWTVEELHLAHFSVKEYLLEQAQFNLENASIAISKTCLTYLTDIRGSDSTIRYDFPMARYAAESWMDYAVSAEASEDIADRSWGNKPGPPRASRLYYAYLITEGADVNAQGGEYGNALQAASSKGHLKVVQLLLDKGADVNMRGGKYGNALQAASSKGHLKVVQLLLDKGADVNMQGGKYGNALYAASINGNVEIMQLLLDKRADVNAQGDKYGNALQVASYEGRQEVVQLLLDKGADVNAWGGEYGKALYAASCKGHREVVQLLLDKGADVNAWGREYGNALQAALNEGHREVVQLLLDKGADVNAEEGGEYGEYGNALCAASLQGNLEVMQLFLDNGADVNAHSGFYGTALQAASYYSSQEVVQLLLDKGADVNAEGRQYGTALQAASLRGNLGIVQLLLNKGADVNGEYGNALQDASVGGNLEIVQLLLDKGADVNGQGDYSHGDALQAASLGGNLEIVQLLLDKGADVNAQSGKYGNALQAASCKGHREVVQLLLDKGADVNARGGWYGNALQAALNEGHREVVQLLLDKGADVNAQGDEYGYYGSALYAASLEGNLEVVQLLLDTGADVNMQGGKYGNALQAASSKGHLEIVQLLLDKGADVNMQGCEYGNALQAALNKGHREVVQLLLDKGADVNAQGGKYGNALQPASFLGDLEIVQLLLDKGADVNMQGGEYGNALRAASFRGRQEVVQLLLDKGADFNMQGGEYGNALYAASLEGHREVVQLLLDKGADVNAQGGKYGNALQAASYEGRQEVVQLLLDKGADVNAWGREYGNALQAALIEGHREVVQLLLDKGADVNMQGGKYGNALQAAWRTCNQGIVQLLLDKGAHINA